jgi:adenylylsulfate kinase-like enzyme
VFAIRDTDFSMMNPFSMYERQEMIRQRFGDKADIVGLPDVDEILVGRDPGFSILHVDVPAEIAEVRATDLRKGVLGKANGKVIWITGNSGSGKSTLARLLRPHLNAVVLDGDEMRRSISTELGFSMEDRLTQNKRVSRLARELSKQCNVIVAVIAPTEAIRVWVSLHCDPVWIWLDRDLPHDDDRPYENPKKGEFRRFIRISNKIMTPDQTLQIALGQLEAFE